MQRGHDGRFRSGPLAGKTVNVKWYTKREGLLDIGLDRLPDYYLVLTGPAAAAMSSRGGTRPWIVSEVFLFEAPPLVERLRARGVAIDIATSVRKDEWERARIYPSAGVGPVSLSEGVKRLLASLGPAVNSRDGSRSTRFFFADPVAQPADVVAHLADGEYHWKRGFSAFELAHSWMAADGFPPTVRRALDTCPDYRGAELVEGFFERKVELESPGRASQTDLMVLVRLASGRHGVIAVEGKVDEPFGDTVAVWKARTTGWPERLSELCTVLSLDPTKVDLLRYQLLHRTVSAIYEANRYGVDDALMLVHSFSAASSSFGEFQAFGRALALDVSGPDQITSASSFRSVHLRLGWIRTGPS